MRALYSGTDSRWRNDLSNSLALSVGKKLTYTPTVSGNQRQFTVMCNVRRTQLGGLHYIFSGGTNCFWYFHSDDTLRWNGTSAVGAYHTTRKFRDTEWMFLGLAVDTVARTIKMVANDEEIDLWDTQTPPTQNAAVGVNLAGTAMQIGEGEFNLSDFVLLDGEVLTPQQMIESRTQPIPFGNNVITSTKKFKIDGQQDYGVNGCQLLCEDGGYLGKSSGGDFLPWSLTGITSDDQLTDTPGDTYPVLSVLNKQATVVVSQGGTQGSYSSTGNTAMAMASVPFPETGKWYYEHTINVVGTAPFVGLHSTRSISGIAGNILSVSYSLFSEEFAYSSNGQKHVQGIHSSYGSTFTSGDTIGVLYDADANTVEFF